MIFERIFSQETQDGLRQWAVAAHGDEMIFDDNASAPEFLAWIWFQLREAEDRPEWFPKGKWATLQALEQFLTKQAREL